MQSLEPQIRRTPSAASHSTNQPATGIRRWFYLLLGLLFLGLAYLGWMLPGLPCTPFVLLASCCFGKSSPRLQHWLLHNRLFGLYLRDFHERRGMRFRMKIRATLFVLIVVTVSVSLLLHAGKPWYAWAFVPLLATVGLSVLWGWVVTLPDRE